MASDAAGGTLSVTTTPIDRPETGTDMNGASVFENLERLLSRPDGAPVDECLRALAELRRKWNDERDTAATLSAAQADAVARSALLLAELEESRTRADELAEAQAAAIVNSALLMAELEEAHEETRRASAALRRAYDALDEEMNVVAGIQRSLLPAKLPTIASLDVAVHYQTSAQAGGDYFDFFPLPEGRWGMLVADVSGHGTPAAVLMAVTHCIAHTHPGPAAPPGKLLGHLNRHLSARYTGGTGRFVTAFYGIWSPTTRELHYACAGHNPPRLRRSADATVVAVDGAAGAPLGILDEEDYTERRVALHDGDRLLLYTDGITEARNPAGELFEVERLDAVLRSASGDSARLLNGILDAVRAFTGDTPADDDRTLVAVTVA